MLELGLDSAIHATGTIDKIRRIALVGDLHDLPVGHVEAMMNKFESLIFGVDAPEISASADLTIPSVGGKKAKLEGGASTTFVLDEDLGIVEDLAVAQDVGPAMG